MRDEDVERENKPAEDAVRAETSEPPQPVQGEVEHGSAGLGGDAEASPPPVARGRGEFAGRTAALRERRAALRQRQAELIARVKERRAQRAVGALDEDQAAVGAAQPAVRHAFADERPGTALVVGLVVGLLVGWLLGRR
jgi:ElaB/YqjD/DUF883 family membrane-anchored ribosome-binding protein